VIRERTSSGPVSAALILLIAAFAAGGASASEGTGGTTSPFCLGAGGRVIALGGAGASVWEESYPLLWNPAGLAAVERMGVGLFHTPLFDESSSYSSIIGSWPSLELGTFSFCVLQLKTGDIERRDSDNMVSGGDLSNRQTRYVLGYGRQLPGGLSAGISMKLDRFEQGDYNANGFGFDAGLGLGGELNSPLIDGAAFGLCARNIVEPKVVLVSEESGDPMGYRGGISIWRSIAGGFDDRLLVAADLDKSRYCEVTLHAGAEYTAGMFSIRAGYDAGFSVFGAGFELREMKLDYAYKSTDLENYHLFSISYSHGPSKLEKLERRKMRREEEIARELAEKTEKYEMELTNGHMRRAREAMDRGSYETAMTGFNMVLLLEPENTAAAEGLKRAGAMEHIQTADSLFENEMYAAAIYEYRRGNDLLPDQKVDERIGLCEKFVKEAEDNGEMIEKLLARAIELYTARNWEEASRAFKEVIDLDPSNEIAATYIVKACDRRQEEYDSSIQQIDRMLVREHFAQVRELVRSGLLSRPGDEALLARQSQLDSILRIRAAEAERKKAAEARLPEAPDARQMETLRADYERGVEHFRKGDFSKSISEWKKVWDSWPDFEDVGEYLVRAYQYRGMELYSAHEYEEALTMWRKILEIDAQNEKAVRYIKRTEIEMSRLKHMTG